MNWIINFYNILTNSKEIITKLQYSKDEEEIKKANEIYKTAFTYFVNDCNIPCEKEGDIFKIILNGNIFTINSDYISPSINKTNPTDKEKSMSYNNSIQDRREENIKNIEDISSEDNIKNDNDNNDLEENFNEEKLNYIEYSKDLTDFNTEEYNENYDLPEDIPVFEDNTAPPEENFGDEIVSVGEPPIEGNLDSSNNYEEEPLDNKEFDSEDEDNNISEISKENEEDKYNFTMNVKDFTLDKYVLQINKNHEKNPIKIIIYLSPIQINIEKPDYIAGFFCGKETDLKALNSEIPNVYSYFNSGDEFKIKIDLEMKNRKLQTNIELIGLEEGVDYILSKRKDFGNGTKGHVCLKEENDKFDVHIFPITDENSKHDRANIIYYIDFKGARENILSDTSKARSKIDGSIKPSFEYEGNYYKITSIYNEDVLYTKII